MLPSFIHDVYETVSPPDMAGLHGEHKILRENIFLGLEDEDDMVSSGSVQLLVPSHLVLSSRRTCRDTDLRFRDALHSSATRALLNT